jgi:hypothetical protein
MNSNSARWFSLSAPGGTVLCCAQCGNSVDLEAPELDHHSRVCPICGVECVYLDWKQRIIQIVLKNAPLVLAEVIRFMQERFDELEYVELLVALEELTDAQSMPVGAGNGITTPDMRDRV